jgi:hypothetical protein
MLMLSCEVAMPSGRERGGRMGVRGLTFELTGLRRQAL